MISLLSEWENTNNFLTSPAVRGLEKSSRDVQTMQVAKSSFRCSRLHTLRLNWNDARARVDKKTTFTTSHFLKVVASRRSSWITVARASGLTPFSQSDTSIARLSLSRPQSSNFEISKATGYERGILSVRTCEPRPILWRVWMHARRDPRRETASRNSCGVFYPGRKERASRPILKVKGESFRDRLRTVKSLPRMMHVKSVCHVDVTIRLHHVIYRCFVARDSTQFFRCGRVWWARRSVSGLHNAIWTCSHLQQY